MNPPDVVNETLYALIPEEWKIGNHRRKLPAMLYGADNNDGFRFIFERHGWAGGPFGPVPPRHAKFQFVCRLCSL
jgi:hypothetical protein